jgi:hypothetical protein
MGGHQHRDRGDHYGDQNEVGLTGNSHGRRLRRPDNHRHHQRVNDDIAEADRTSHQELTQHNASSLKPHLAKFDFNIEPSTFPCCSALDE